MASSVGHRGLLLAFSSVLLACLTTTLGNGLDRAAQKQRVVGIRTNELNRINYHETVNVQLLNLTSNNKLLKFNAFGNDYEITLFPNNKLIPSNIKQDIPSHVKQSNLYFAKSKQSCHYFGKLRNKLSGVTTSNNNDKFISVSICDKRGIHGMIETHDNDTIVIKPKNYYSEIAYDTVPYHHHWSHDHLVYLRSDYDDTDVPMPNSLNIPLLNADSDLNNNDNEDNGNNNDNIISDLGSRSRLLESDGQNNVEMLIVSDPSHTNLYELLYGDDQWYDELIASFVDAVNRASNLYYVTDWGNNIGTISASIVEVILWYDFNDQSTNYYTVAPDWTNTSCTTSYVCSIDGSGYLGKFVSWTYTYQSDETYDNAHLWSSEYFEGAAGWGYVGTVCTFSGYSTSTISAVYGADYAWTTVAHELGHNFGMQHDSDGNECASDAGIMGSNDEQFSTCSIDYLQDHFSTTNMSCLITTVSNDNSDQYEPQCGNYVLEYNEECDCGTASECNSILGNGCCDYTQCTLKNDTCEWCQHDADCYELENLRSDLDGQYVYGGCYNDVGYYLKYDTSDYYLWYHSGNEWWIIGNALGSWSAYCSQSEISACHLYQAWFVPEDGSYVAQTDTFSGSCANSTCNDGILQFGESCDCGHFYECQFIDKCCDEYTCQYKDASVCDPSETCTYYPCVTFSGFSGGYESYNGDYNYGGCHNDEAYYVTNDSSLYLYFSATYNNWHIYSSINDATASAYSSYDDLTEASGNWFISNGGWTVDANITNQVCDQIEYDPDISDTSDTCDDGGVDVVCIENIDSNSIGSTSMTFNFANGCKDDYPYYYDSDNSYYLHYIPYTLNQWIISSNVEDVVGVAYCEKENILSCVENKWYVETQIGDSLAYEVDTDAVASDCNDGNGNKNGVSRKDASLNYVLVLVIVFVYVWQV